MDWNCNSNQSFFKEAHFYGNSPLEKKDVLRPMHSVGGGEFGGADEEDEAAVAERYLVPFQITNLPNTVSRDSLRVLCRLAPPRLLDESLLEHSPTASTSSDDEARVSIVCERWPTDSTCVCNCNCCLFRIFRRFFRFLRLLPPLPSPSSSASSVSWFEHIRPSSLLLDIVLLVIVPRWAVSVDSVSSQSFTLESRDINFHGTFQGRIGTIGRGHAVWHGRCAFLCLTIYLIIAEISVGNATRNRRRFVKRKIWIKVIENNLKDNTKA